jgi:hypothetical protein
MIKHEVEKDSKVHRRTSSIDRPLLVRNGYQLLIQFEVID